MASPRAAEREATVQRGPRGLGVAIGIAVDDLLATYRWVENNGCQITSEPHRAAFGDDIFECMDPDGYLWEISQTPNTTQRGLQQGDVMQSAQRGL